jgi:YihY family inner membrane protein
VSELNAGTSTEVQTEVQADLQTEAAVIEAVVNAGATASAETKASAISKVEAVAHSKWYLWRKDGTALVNYLLDSEVHTFAFSVAANAILSFIPFIFMLYTLSRTIFNSTIMEGVVSDIAKDFLPAALRHQDFWEKNLGSQAPHHVQFFSLLMILVACTGIFLPLEVALNQAWGVVKSRNYLANQVVALGLATLMVLLGFGCVLVNAGFRATENLILPHGLKLLSIDFSGGVSYLVLALTTGLASIVFFFAVYWLLPNRKVPPAPVMRTAVVTGTIWLGARYIFALVLPHLDLGAIYGPFYVSVGLIFWAYVSGLIMFAGAQFSVARRGSQREES